ncbi:MAG: DegT/DnrJ/EryC1/StrS family aminotransferase [Acidobacteriia bacterium]|nr:DegT/DnrJ/EryC1/StrS family aminotransferase [Terriglobia bacterium]
MDHRQIPLLDLASQHSPIRDELLAAIVRVLDSQKFILGEDVARLEQEIAAYVGTPHAIACASGSDALSLALWALDIQPGDEVLTTPFTFFATAGSISRVGARPVFLDIEPATFNMDMNRVEEALQAHPRVRAIIPVHLFGGCADMNSLAILAEKRGISIIEDAAQAIGSECTGKRAGSLGVIGCFSFYPTKNLGGLGDGGMLTTHDGGLAARLKALRIHGQTGPYLHDWIGINSRLDTLQAAALRVKLKYLDNWTGRRQENAGCYRKMLATAGSPVLPPVPAPYQTRHIYNQFVIRGPDRDRLREFLKEQGVGTEVYYPVPLHLQRCFAHLGYQRGDFPASEKAASEVLALPVNPEVSFDDIAYVCQAITSFYRR